MKKKQQNGITLIALIITIIVMLILVGVTVSTALNGGLFTTAKEAAKGTEAERNKEIALSGEEVQIDGIVYASMDDYLNNNPKLPDGWTVATDEERIAAWPTETVKNENVTAIKEPITNKIVPLPKGFQVSLVEGENTIDNGLVITDGANEFVWIPYSGTYTEYNLGPLTVTDDTSGYGVDSQDQLDYYYGEGYFNYSEDFNYEEDKTNIEASINKYKGFYVGRYETTIDESGTIGSMRNKTVLTAGKTIAQTNNKPCRWYGLYKLQKDMYTENQAVFSTMITSKEWNAIMNFTGYVNAKRPTDTYTTYPDKSGSAYKGTTDTYDLSKNIYDLAGNVCELTLTTGFDRGRVYCGGRFGDSSLSSSYSFFTLPYVNYNFYRF